MRAIGGGVLTVVVLNFIPGLTLISPFLGSIVAGYLYGISSTYESDRWSVHRTGLVVVAILLPVALLVPPIANPELFPATFPAIAVARVINGGFVQIGYPDTYAGFAAIYVAVTTILFVFSGYLGDAVSNRLSRFAPSRADDHT
jgi:MFS family permease